MIHRLTAVALTTVSLFAQQPSTPAAPATPATPAPALEAGAPAATALVDKAIAKMKAYGKGSFATTQTNDSAMLRGAGLPFGNDDIEVTGGWSQGTVWGENDGDSFVRANGRMLAKIGSDWKLRGSKLGGGKPAPFTLDPDLLFTALGSLPAPARKVANVDTAEVGGKTVHVLSLALESQAASDFAESGAVPGAAGGFFAFGAPGMDVPENEYTVYLALFIEPESGDLLRFVCKTFEKNEMMGHVKIAVAGGDGEAAEAEDAKDEKKSEKDDGTLVWKKGLPQKKPAKDESVTTFRVDFKKLGLADAPSLPDKAKALLRMQ
jgi:hypothetical protein